MVILGIEPNIVKGSNEFNLLLYLFIIKKKKDLNFYNVYKFRIKVVRLGNELRTFRGSTELIKLLQKKKKEKKKKVNI